MSFEKVRLPNLLDVVFLNFDFFLTRQGKHIALHIRGYCHSSIVRDPDERVAFCRIRKTDDKKFKVLVSGHFLGEVNRCFFYVVFECYL